MLWILFVIGGIGAGLMFLFIIVELFDSRCWKRIARLATKMGISFVVGLVGFLGILGIDALKYEEVSQTYNRELISLTDSSQFLEKEYRGLFYVYVSVNKNKVYSFYYKVGDDGFRNGKVKVNRTTIYERDNCTPHIVEYTTYTKNKMNKVLRVILAFGYGEDSEKNYEIYTPKGTILRTFELDSQ